MSALTTVLFDAKSDAQRVRLVAILVGVLFLAVAVKGGLTALTGDQTRVTTALPEPAFDQRADIVDRNGELLATSVTVYSLFADPRAIWNAGETARALATVFEGLDIDALEARLANRDRAFVWVRRGLTPRQRQAVFELGLEGLGFREERQRAYPRGALAGHVLGYAGIDGNGLAGVEYALNDRLAASSEPLALTLDAGVQFGLESELATAAERYQVDGAAGVLMETQTGNILAMASWPPLDPNRARTLSADNPALLDRAARAVYELGSVYKPLTVGLALDADTIKTTDIFDIDTPLIISGYEITDTHPIDVPATPTIIVSESSNIGTVRVAQRVGGEALAAFYDSLGLFEKPDIQLSGAAAPLLPAAWTELSVATASYGHGIAVSPLAFTTAFCAIGNNGEAVFANLVVGETRPIGARILSEQTVDTIVDMMRVAVIDGTGAAANVEGYLIAGKTGTAEKPIVGGYSETENISSFAALFPADRPEYALLIVLDTPKASNEREASGEVMSTTAARNAAPTAARVIQRTAPLLGLAPRVAAEDRSTPATRSG